MLIVQIEEEVCTGSKSFVVLRTSKIVEIISTATADRVSIHMDSKYVFKLEFNIANNQIIKEHYEIYAHVLQSLLVDERPTGLCVNQQKTNVTWKPQENEKIDENLRKGKVILTTVALLASHKEPIVYTWMKCT